MFNWFNHVYIKGLTGFCESYEFLFCESTNLAVYVLRNAWLPDKTLPTRVRLTPWGTHATFWADQHDATSYFILHFVWVYLHAVRHCGFGANIFWNDREKYGVKTARDKIADHKLSCSDIISAFLWLTNAPSFGLLPSAILQTMNELVSIQLKTSKANKLLMISIIVLAFVDLELEGIC